MARGQFGIVMRYLRRRAAAPSAGELTDLQLLACFDRDRDDNSFATLVERHGPMVLAVCRRVLGDSHDADDAFQATFLVLAQKAGSTRWHDSVGPWLYEVAYRVAARTRSDAARRRLRERQVADMRRAEVAEGSRELREVLDEELTRLPEKYRAPLVLCYLEGKTNEEAARLLSCAQGTVFSRLARGRDLLRDRLVRRGLALSGALLPAVLETSAAPAALPASLLTSTVQAATTGAASAVVAGLTKGAIKAMFWTKFRAISGGVVAVGLLAVVIGLAVYHTLAAETVAVPVPEPATTRQAKVVEPAVKDGLSVLVVPAKAVFAEKEPLAFRVTFTNVSKSTLLLFPHTRIADLRIEDSKKVGWRYVSCSPGPPPAEAPPYVRAMAPGYKQTGTTELVPPSKWERFVQENTKPDLKTGLEHLPPGKYRIQGTFTFWSHLGFMKDKAPAYYNSTAKVYDYSTHKVIELRELKSPCKEWVGTIASNPAEFEIAPEKRGAK